MLHLNQLLLIGYIFDAHIFVKYSRLLIKTKNFTEILNLLHIKTKRHMFTKKLVKKKRDDYTKLTILFEFVNLAKV